MPRQLIRDFGASSISFAGVNGVGTASNQRSVYTALTMECWIRPRAYAANSWVMSLHNSGHSGDLVIGSTGIMSVSIFDGGSQTATSNVAIPKEGWTHVVMTAANGSKVRLYINGAVQTVLSGTIGTIQDLGAGTVLYMGGRPPGANYYNGKMSLARIYASELTAAQVAQLYSTSVVPSGVTLDGEWLNNTGSGSSQADTSSGAHASALTGGFAWETDSPMRARTAVS